MWDDPFDLQRFLTAQQGDFSRALRELQAGRKATHWMWYLFPQLRGLGSSAMAVRYGIASLDEARAYLAHPVLSERLGRATQAVLAHSGRSLAAIFGAPDNVKFRSSMTLFDRASEAPDNTFRQALDRFCGGDPDPSTLALLSTAGRQASARNGWT